MLNSYVEIFDKIKEEILSWVDDDYFIMGKDFMRFRFKTDNELVYNKKNQHSSCVIKKGDIYYPQTKLQKCLYESNFLKN